MKSDRYAGDYNQVRRAAGLAQPEFPDDLPSSKPRFQPDTFDADFHKRMGDRLAHEAAESMVRKQNADRLTQEANKSALLGEYAKAQVDPPFVKEDGTPKFSLSFLFRMGWSIQFEGSRNVLVGPIEAKNK